MTNKNNKVMKTNETPEKIYIQPSTIEQLPHQNIVYTKPLADNSIEYTRTDVFIEKACEYFAQHIKDNERIRQFLIHEVEETSDEIMSYRNMNKKDVLAWLEKQGEQKPTCLLDNSESNVKFPFKAKVKSNGKIVIIHGGQLSMDCKKWVKYQSNEADGYMVYEPGDLELVCNIEQEFDNKIEPKFNVGDIIINKENGAISKINNILPYDYELISFETRNHLILDQNVINGNSRLWTIQDAKNGDVLVTQQTDITYETIFIFNKIENNRIIQHLHYFITDAGEEVCEARSADGFLGFVGTTVYPATKEQRDILFAKMKEAGYEWDAEKLELKNIEKNPSQNANAAFGVGDVITDGNSTFEIVGIKDGHYLTDDGDKVCFYVAHRYYTPVKKHVEQHPAWSEEDEELLGWTINNLTEIEQRFGKDYGKVEKCINWIKQKRWKKSLKTADLENSLCDIQDGYSDTSYEYRVLGEAIEFIRSTDDPHAWRPSDEQVEALEKECIAHSNYELCRLLEQLKKLKE